MLNCPECDSTCNEGSIVSNRVTCPVCDRPVYIVRDPRDRSATYPALSNSDVLDVPDEVLTYAIVDQSPTHQPPRNMLLEFPGGFACLIAQCSNRTQPSRKSLGKTASAINRTVVSIHLPEELMSYVRSTATPYNNAVNRSGEVERLEEDHQPSPPADR